MSEVCNIGARGVRARWIGGAAAFLVVLAALVLPWLWERPRAWRLLLFVPLFVAFLSVFQAQAKT